MSTSILPVKYSTLGNRAWKPSPDYRFAAGSQICPVTRDELALAVCNFPLAFVPGPRPSLVALLGFGDLRNVFINPAGQWIGAYVPAVLRSYPFKLLPAQDGQFALGYDTASGLIVDAGEGEPFFVSETQPAERIQQVMQHLVRVHQGQQALSDAAALLARHELLEPWPITIRQDEREIPVSGLLRVSEQGLAQLDDVGFVELRRAGALHLAHAQMLSMPNTTVLGGLAQIHARHSALASRREAEVSAMFEPLTESDGEIDWAALLNEDQA